MPHLRWLHSALRKCPAAGIYTTNASGIHLTFDDGPHPEVTPRVLDTLAAANARATFFVLGERAVRYPELIQRMHRDGHRVANHGYRHLNGWKTATKEYLDNHQRGADASGSELFRPPYGRITPAQWWHLRQHPIVFWSHSSRDFDAGLSTANHLTCATHGADMGSIVVFHDSEKAWPQLKPLLPLCLSHFSHMSLPFLPL